jgi:hypothetical protein
MAPARADSKAAWNDAAIPGKVYDDATLEPYVGTIWVIASEDCLYRLGAELVHNSVPTLSISVEVFACDV